MIQYWKTFKKTHYNSHTRKNSVQLDSSIHDTETLNIEIFCFYISQTSNVLHKLYALQF